MLYLDSTSTDATFHINTKGNGGDAIDFSFIREGESSASYTETVTLSQGGYYQTASFDLNTMQSSLTDGATYDVFAYSGGLLVYKDKMYYNSTRELGESTIEQYTENSTTNDYLIFD